MLELFAGTKSVSRAFETMGVETLTIDNVEALQPDICCDIMLWDYAQFQPGHFDVIWASPPCTQYSIARSNAKTPRDLEYADSLVERALEIIRYFKPLAWYIENPSSGLLRTRRVLRGLPSVTISYCKYGHPYQQNTTISTNVEHMWRPRCKFDCDAVKDGRHTNWAQKAGKKDARGFKRLELCTIPDALCKDIVCASFGAQRLSSLGTITGHPQACD